jgi:hypothetical protein
MDRCPTRFRGTITAEPLQAARSDISNAEKKVSFQSGSDKNLRATQNLHLLRRSLL